MTSLMLSPAIYDVHKLESELRETRRAHRLDTTGTARLSGSVEHTTRRQRALTRLAAAMGMF